MSNVAPGVYTLRLDQLDGAGQVSARFETPFKREDRAALAAAAAQVAQQAADAAAVAQDQSADTGAMTTSVPTDTQPAAVAPVQAITVQPGNTLWGISRARYGQGILYVRVFDANRDKIRDPDLIYPGQVFVLPSQAQ
jgi:nucleoid-associated protein YgaU